MKPATPDRTQTSDAPHPRKDLSPDIRPLVASDISACMRNQRHQALVIRELNHRLRNLFAVVQGTARQVFTDWKDATSPSALFLARLNALARSHSLLAASRLQGLSIRDIALEEISAYIGDDMRRCLCQGPDIMVKASAAGPLGMICHELATNSAKYGALSVAAGRVHLSWTITREGDDQYLHLNWREFGGPPVETPQRRGLGSRMLESELAAEIGGRGELTFRASGVCYALAAPLAAVASP